MAEQTPLRTMGLFVRTDTGASYAMFVPQPDITAYEVATLFPFLLGAQLVTPEEWEAIGPAQRHLKLE